MNFDNLKEAIQGAFDALVTRLGEASPKPHVQEKPGERPGFMLVRQGYEVVPVQREPSPQVRHNFNDIESFAAYLTRGTDYDGAKVDILFSNGDFMAHDKPYELDHDIIKCTLEPHPTMSLWKDARCNMDQLAFRELLRTCPEVFQAMTGDTNTATYLLGEIQALEVKKVINWVRELGPNGEIRVFGEGGDVTHSLKLPPFVEIEIPWFMGIDKTYKIEVFIDIDVSDRAPSFKLSAPKWDLVKHKAELDAVASLRSILGEGWTVGLGVASVTGG